MELSNGQMTELLCAVLKCGTADLRMLGQFDNYEMYKLIDYLDESGMDLELNNLLWAGIQLAFTEVQEDISSKLELMEEEIEDLPKDDGTRERIEEILDMDLELENDCETFFNYIDTHVTLISNVEIYQEFFQDELDRFEELTGFTLI